MNSAQQEFLRILRDYIRNEAGEYCISPELLSYAKTHEVEGIVYRQTGYDGLKASYAYAIYAYKNRENSETKMSQCLKDIPHFYVKGLLLASYYPDPGLRTMGDSDLIVREEDVQEVLDILKKNGYTLAKQAESVSVVSKGTSEFEIHTSLIHSGIGNKKAKEYFSRCWNYVKDNRLDKSYHFIFVLQHLKGHMISHGVGYRLFMDVALFARDPELKWGWIVDELQKIELLRFAEVVFAFNKKWFGTEPPIQISELDDDFYEKASEKIFEGGVFGQNDASNREPVIVKQAMNDNVNLKKARHRYFLRQLFPNYATMSKLPYCKYVKKSRLLLPIAWIHRIFYRAFDKKSRNRFIDRTTINEASQERLELLRKWGL